MSYKQSLGQMNSTGKNEYDYANKDSPGANNSSSNDEQKEGYSFTEKDYNTIYEVIVGFGIDPRSLAFELITRRVVNKINSFDEQHCSLFKKDCKNSIHNLVKEVIDNDKNLCYTLNGIFLGAATTPVRTHLPIVEEKKTNYQSSSPKKLERCRSLPKVAKESKKIKMSPRPSEITSKGCISNAKKQRATSKINTSSPVKKKVKKASSRIKVVENEKRLDSCSFFNDEVSKNNQINKTYDNHMLKEDTENSISQWKHDDNNEVPTQAAEAQGIEFSQLLDSDILLKEYELGKQLIAHASQKLEVKTYSNMLYESHLTNEDFKIIGIFLSLLFSIRDNEDKQFEKWDEIQQCLFNSKEVYEIQNNLSSLIEKDNFIAEKTHKFRDQFVHFSSHNSESHSIVSMKEYLCEAFCLIDIIEEIKSLQQKLPILVNPQTPQEKVVENNQHRAEEITEEIQKTERTNQSEKINIENNFEANNVDVSKEIMKDIRSRYYATPDISINDYADSNMNSINNSIVVPNTSKNSYFDKIKQCNSPSKCIKKLDTKQSSSKKNLKTKLKAVNEVSRDSQYTYSHKNQRNSELKARNNTGISSKRTNKESSPSKLSRLSTAKTKTQTNQNKIINTPIKSSQKSIEKKLESRLPSTINSYHQTQRKTPRSTVKPVVKKDTLGNKQNYSPVRCHIEYCDQSPKRKGVTPAQSPKRKSPNRNAGTMSPTKRMILMKNSYIKNQKKAQKDPSNSGKMIYTISPDEAYIVDKEFFNSMENEDIAKKSEEMCKTADQQRSLMYGDSMVKYRHRRDYGDNQYI